MAMANGLPHRLTAMPHPAIPHAGSALSVALNPSIAGRNSNECNSVIARLNGAWASALHDV